MTILDKPAEPKRAAPPKQVKPKAQPTASTNSSAPSKGGPKIQEEDIGAGLSKEEAEEKMNQTFPVEIVSKFEEAKWQDKVEGFKSLGE